jgi:hypothetical protein
MRRFDLDEWDRTEQQLLDHAEQIFLTWKDGMWKLKDEASTLSFTTKKWREENGKEKDVKKETHSLSDTIVNALTEYEAFRGLPHAISYARSLILTYNFAKSRDLVEETEGFMRKFGEFQREIRTLKQELETTTIEKEKFKKRWEECTDSMNRGRTEISHVENGDDGDKTSAN